MRHATTFFTIATLCLLAGCPAPMMPDAGDASGDVATDQPRTDAQSDATPDAGPEASADARLDATPDAPAPDAPAPDVAIDTPAADARPDAAPDAPAPDATPDASSDGSTACGVPGDYSLTIMGMMAYFRFTPTMTWQGALMRTDLGTASAIALGNWSLTGATITLTTDPGSPVSGCAPGDIGVYTVAFGAACGTMTWTRVSDTCTSRGAALDGAMYTRL